MELFKVLAVDGSACNGGSGKWYLPRGRRPGKWMPPLKVDICHSGYHLVTAEGILDWVTADDNLIFSAEGRGVSEQLENKYCFTESRLLGPRLIWNAKVARLFACDCAERTLWAFEDEYPDDLRPRQCVEVSRSFAIGNATKQELDAAGAAARVAARDAAWAAAWAAAGAAARVAARVAAGAAEKSWQTQRLLQYLRGEVV